MTKPLGTSRREKVELGYPKKLLFLPFFAAGLWSLIFLLPTKGTVELGDVLGAIVFPYGSILWWTYTLWMPRVRITPVGLEHRHFSPWWRRIRFDEIDHVEEMSAWLGSNGVGWKFHRKPPGGRPLRLLNVFLLGERNRQRILRAVSAARPDLETGMPLESAPIPSRGAPRVVPVGQPLRPDWSRLRVHAVSLMVAVPVAGALVMYLGLEAIPDLGEPFNTITFFAFIAAMAWILMATARLASLRRTGLWVSTEHIRYRTLFHRNRAPLARLELVLDGDDAWELRDRQTRDPFGEGVVLRRLPEPRRRELFAFLESRVPAVRLRRGEPP